MGGKSGLDALDFALLEALEEDARAPLKRLAHRLKKPASTLFARVQRLKSRGVIRRYTVDVDEEALGFGVQAFVLVKFDAGAAVSQQALAEKLARLAWVREAHIIAGEHDLLLRVRAKDTRALGRQVLEGVRGCRGVAETRTLVVFYSAGEERAKRSGSRRG